MLLNERVLEWLYLYFFPLLHQFPAKAQRETVAKLQSRMQ